jgi:UDP-GlcNAc:undecaprenyl-phosphate/decaprenyl-phosphate GlcNAc-1-phosphate transferase
MPIFYSLSLPVSIYPVSLPSWMLIIMGLVMAFGITWFIIPSIVAVSILKDLSAKANGRTSHTGSTPTLGGIAVFIGFVLSTVIMAGTHDLLEMRYVIAGLIIIFFIGIKDDILVIDPLKKLAGQIVASSILVVFADIRITNLYGLFHIGQLPFLVSLLLTVFVFIVVINGFNLIDGIDGLASGTGVLASFVFALWFWKNGDIPNAIFCFSIIGSLSAFFIYNVFGRKNKIFLGDTGSMLIGFILSILTCRFLQQELVSHGNIKFPAAPAMVIGILIIPLYDSLRVFILRISNGKSPFKADKQHLHHRLLQLGFSHLESTIILLSANVFFIFFAFFLQGVGMIYLVFYEAGIATILSYILVRLAQKHTQNLTEVEMLVAEYLKNLYRKKDPKSKRVEKTNVHGPHPAAIITN